MDSTRSGEKVPRCMPKTSCMAKTLTYATLLVIIRLIMRKVLVVEDHPDMRDLLVWQMELMGFSAIPAKHGKEGVEKAVEEKPQLILMDIMMPGMDGREATRILRSNPDTQGIPILAATALFREADLKSCIEAGCNDYIVKPFTFQELRGKIQEYVPMPGASIQ